MSTEPKGINKDWLTAEPRANLWEKAKLADL